jgi:hypothetical protein
MTARSAPIPEVPTPVEHIRQYVRVRRAAGVFAFCVMCSLFVLGLSTGAGATEGSPPAVSIEPTTGPAGTTITVSGTGCPQGEWGAFTWQVHVGVGRNGEVPSAGSITEPDGSAANGVGTSFTQDGYPGRADADATPDTSGSWSVQLKIPGPGDNLPATPGRYPVGAVCYAKEGTNVGRVNYATAQFDVTGERLARTGRTSIGYEFVAAVALIGVGMELVRQSRRRDPGKRAGT